MAIKRLPAWAYGAIALVPMLILMVFIDRLDTASTIELLIPALFWGFAFAFMSWKRTDEAARQANKVGWLHGGGLGLIAAVISVPVVLFLPAAGDLVDHTMAAWSPRLPAGQGGFALGVLTTVMLQTTGFLIAWAGWWIRRR